MSQYIKPSEPSPAFNQNSAITPVSPEPRAASEEPSPGRWRWQTFRALRHRNYRLYFSGQMVSLTGSWVQTAALTWLAYDLTRQSLWAGLIFAAQVLPTCLLGVLGGTLADRWPKRDLLLTT